MTLIILFNDFGSLGQRRLKINWMNNITYMSGSPEKYISRNAVTLLAAGSLCDGRGAGINIMGVIIQASGCELIHLGHNRSGQESVDCAVQEDVQAIAVTAYQGGHMEFFRYMF